VLRHFPSGRTPRIRIAAVTVLSTSLLAAALSVPAASAASSDGRDALTHHNAQLNHNIARSQVDVDEISKRLLSAQARLSVGRSDLFVARARVSELTAEVQQATLRDARMRRALTVAVHRLDNAKADLARGLATSATERSTLAGYAVSNAQAGLTQLSTLGLVFNAHSTQQALNQVQVQNSALDKQLTDLERLRANQVFLRYTEQRVQRATDLVAAHRRAAAANLATMENLEADAASAQADVQQRVAALKGQRNELAAAKTAELGRIEAMKREQARVDARLRKIAAAARAAAARSSASSMSTASSDGGFLSWPVTNTYITSPFGMRLNPVIHVFELHDGTDFHALCGTPVYAAAPGRVSAEYWNDAYGNRLFIDHGLVKGVSLSTSYNHLTSYVAHVGQQVARGQLVAYSGTTGWSTGCHLHFSVYVNGVAVNPVLWL
jgi:murein DD-endopeptidase MepM/ murein hydrolase activator NlpD